MYFIFVQVCKPCNLCVADIDLHVKKTHLKLGVDHRIFKAMNCEQANVAKMSLERYASSDIICPPAQKAAIEFLNEFSNSPYERPSFAKNCRSVKESDIRQYKIKLTEFEHIYETFDGFAVDFQDWMKEILNHSDDASKQIVANLKEIWQSMDVNLNLFPNKLSDTNLLEDRFFIPHFRKLKDFNLKMTRSKKNLKPSTVCTKMSSLRKLIDFSTSRKLYIGNCIYPLF